MNKPRTGAFLAAVALSATSLVGCSGGGDAEYCENASMDESGLEDAMAAASSGDADQIAELMSRAKEMAQDAADSAPDEVADDWQTVIEGFDTLEPMLGDFAEYMEDPAEHADELEALSDDLASRMSGMTEATTAIQTDAEERCGAGDDS